MRNELQCDWMAWRKLFYDTLILDLPKNNICDMTGAVNIAKQLLPEVMRIITTENGKPSTEYRVDNQGNWKAYG